MAAMSGKRLHWIDVAKGMGIMLVVYGHVMRGLVSAGLAPDSPTFQVVDSVIYSFHMPLFFFLAGIFLDQALAKRGVGGVVLSKIDTILYPYLVWSLLQGFIEVLLARYTNGATEAGDVLALLWAPRAQFWFLYALFQIFIVSAVLFSFKARWLPYLILGAAALSFIFARAEYMGPFIHAARMMVFFVLGVVFFRLSKAEIGRAPMVTLVLFSTFAVVEYVFHSFAGLRYSDRSLFSLLIACTGIAATVSVASLVTGRLSSGLAYLGRMSMYIYLGHILVASGMRVGLSRAWPECPVWLHVIAGLVAGIALPIVLYRLCKRWQLMFLFEPPRRLAAQGWGRASA